MKTITRDSGREYKCQEIFVRWNMQQQLISLIDHQRSTSGNKKVAVDEESEETIHVIAK